MIPIVVFASGSGSGFESIADAVQAGRLDAEIRALVCDQPSALVLEKARKRGIRTILVPKAQGESRASHDERILAEILPLQPRFLVMAGYMRIVSSKLLESFRSERGYARVVNIHPSLLPSFPGVGAYAQAYRYGAKVAGATVHLVELEVDSGPICAQVAFPMDGLRSEAEVEEKGKALEQRLYPETLSWVLPEKFEIESRESAAIAARRLCVRPY
jgi:phosphoribosylglycinamide formyltransferase-1